MKRNGLAIIFLQFLLIFLFSSCSVQRKIGKVAKEEVLNAAALKTAHVGISIYDPASRKYWYDYNGEKYFVPASNVKIPTCYAAMKYLGDSLVGLRYHFLDDKFVVIQPTGDPSFLLSEFVKQPVFEFLKKLGGHQIILSSPQWETAGLGAGWSWDDYAESYMAERSVMPIHGNVVKFRHNGKRYVATPGFFKVPNEIYDSDVLTSFDSVSNRFIIKRSRDANSYSLESSGKSLDSTEIPFVTGIGVISSLLRDTLHQSIATDNLFDKTKSRLIHSQPSDSVLRPMMHRSDNFFAEQMLLMVSNEKLGVMNDEKIIDTLLRSDFSDLPHKPNWVDGSGLSRYNLFTPDDMVAILEKMKNEFGMERIKNIFPTGGRGTLTNYYKSDSNYLFAKTGTLSGVVALSGFLYTKKGKPLIFSVLVNNHQSSATEVRRAIEKFLQAIRRRY